MDAAEPWPFSFVDEVRYGDLDANRHLNNVAVHQFYESARVAYIGRLLPDVDLAGGGDELPVIFAETHVVFRAPGHYGDVLRVDVRPTDLRRSSVRIAFRIVREGDGRTIADGWGTLVGFDYREQRAARLPERLVEALRADGASAAATGGT